MATDGLCPDFHAGNKHGRATGRAGNYHGLTVKVEDGMPAEECSCHRCKAGLTDIGDDDVSDFFNDLHMVRGRKGIWKIIDGKEVRR